MFASRSPDPYEIRKLVQVRALVRHGYPEPKRYAERIGYLFDLERKDPEIAEAELSERLGARCGKHEAGVYWGVIDLAEEEIAKSKEPLQLIEGLSR